MMPRRKTPRVRAGLCAPDQCLAQRLSRAGLAQGSAEHCVHCGGDGGSLQGGLEPCFRLSDGLLAGSMNRAERRKSPVRCLAPVEHGPFLRHERSCFFSEP